MYPLPSHYRAPLLMIPLFTLSNFCHSQIFCHVPIFIYSQFLFILFLAAYKMVMLAVAAKIYHNHILLLIELVFTSLLCVGLGLSEIPLIIILTCCGGGRLGWVTTLRWFWLYH